MNDKDLAQFIEEHGIQAELVQLNRETPTVEAAATAVGVATDRPWWRPSRGHKGGL